MSGRQFELPMPRQRRRRETQALHDQVVRLRKAGLRVYRGGAGTVLVNGKRWSALLVSKGALQ